MFKYAIGDLIKYKSSLVLEKNDKTKKAVEIFNKNKKIQSIVVLDNNQPIGLVMRDKIFFQLGTRFGFNLYFDKCITKVMDKYPLIVDYFTPLKDVSKLTMNRSQDKIYDEVIIVKNKNYYTTVSIKDLLLQVSKKRIIEARNANPLSGLPGNISIDKEIITRLENRDSFSVLYIDIDNFKAYNDTYGYQKGDQFIHYTAGILKNVANKLDYNSFVGHVGGDDFIVITKSNKDEEIAKHIIMEYENSLSNYFKNEHWEKGYLLLSNRQKEITKVPLSTISIAIVSNKNNDISNYLSIGDKASEIKKIVKKMPGNNYFKDRRV